MTRGCHISVRELSVSFGGALATLSSLQAEITAGQFVGLIGPSGCGKSTLLRCVASLCVPTAGQIVFGEAGTPQPTLAYVFQDPTLLPWRTVVDNIALPLELRGVSKELRQRAAGDAMRRVGLQDEDARKLPRMLSGGMRMRVSLARAVITEPDVLLLDEPFAALDDISRQQLNRELMELWLSRSWTGLFVTHNVTEAVFLCQRILVMSQMAGNISADIPIPLPYPRTADTRISSEFIQLTAHVAASLQQSSQA